jgi:transposase
VFGVDAMVVEAVDLDEGAEVLVAHVRPRRGAQRRCGRCGRRGPWYDRGEGRRRWRGLDLGLVQTFLEADAPRVDCPEHGPTVIKVPWARHNAGHTYAFDDTVAWLATHCSKSAVAELLRIAWRTVGVIITRVVADRDGELGDRLARVRRIGIDEVSYRRGHNYLTVVVDHDTGQLLWAAPGRDKKTLGAFFNLLGPERRARIALVSADGADWIADLVALRCPKAQLCMDPFHVVAWAGKALDEVRRETWRATRAAGNAAHARALKDARYALWKNPEDLTDRQRAKLAWIAKINQPLFRAYLLKEHLRMVFAPGGEERIELLDDWLAWAAASRIPAFVELARKMRRYRDDIAHALLHRLSNAPVESINTKIRLLTRIAFGFKSVDALLALVMLHLGGYARPLPGRT